MIERTEIKSDTAVLVGIITPQQPVNKSKEYLDELAFLAETLEIKTLKVFTQKLDRPDQRTFVKKGKLQEIMDYVKLKSVELIIFDDELSPAHIRNLERTFKEEGCAARVVDRSLLILEIFSFRAQTAQARTQVELARYQYMLPRLTRLWSHLERQRGGTGTRGGSGEKEIETDRRIIKNKIAQLKEKLTDIEKQSITRRKSRAEMVRVALVGYTNVGKSTLMRLLSKENVFAENKLFATVDSTVRRVTWNNIPFLLTDTVGFIRKLPTTLIESFKSTLAEITDAHILLHVVDISHQSFEEQIEVVKKTLADIKATDKIIITIFNKIDAYSNDVVVGNSYLICPPSLEELRESYLVNNQDAVFISAAGKTNIDLLKNLIFEKVKAEHLRIYPNYLDESLKHNQIFEE
jgi:GTP-binding protein HflX